MKKSISYNEAKAIAQTLEFETKREYQSGTLPEGLVKNPVLKYPDEYEGWCVYLGKRIPSDVEIEQEILELFRTTYMRSLHDWSHCKRIGLLKSYMPLDLKDKFGEGFVKQCLAESKTNYSYDELVEILVKHEVTTLAQYEAFWARHLELRLPKKPYSKFNVKWSDIKSSVQARITEERQKRLATN